VQRLFSNFADGWPGVGLLMQRLAAGGALVYCGAASLTAAPHFELAAPRLLGAAAGALLLAGSWTPVAGTLVAILELWIAFSQPGNPWMALLLAVQGASLAMIGPGAWSVDARLFGRKQINPDI
jgi:putative oxidoreductase